jgi:hypothetical protein
VLSGDIPNTPGRAVDLALTDARLGDWLVGHPASSWTTLPRLTYRPLSQDFVLVIEGADGTTAVATVANQGHGPVEVAITGG